MRFVSFTFALVLVFVTACGSEKRNDGPEVSIKLCDPIDNPSACPQNLRESSSFSRKLVFGNPDLGIEVKGTSPADYNKVCRDLKLTMLDQALANENIAGLGLYEGEFVESYQASLRSIDERCTERNVLKSCSRRETYSRIICEYSIHRFTTPAQ